MRDNATSPSVPGEEGPAIPWFPWLTSRRLILFVIGWVSLFAIGSVFVSNPFATETSALAKPDYAHIMYLHGLLIGMVGLLAVLTGQVFCPRARHTQVWVAAGVVVATILAAVGGIWDRTIPGSEAPMWTQVFGFFALDEILLVLLLGMGNEWRRVPATRSVAHLTGIFAVAAMLSAALIGHLAGWIEEFGWQFPPVFASYAQAVGFGKQKDFTDALMGAHSHALVIGTMALAIALVAQQFGYTRLSGPARRTIQVGLGMVAAGTVLMAVMYIVMGFTTWSPPTAFVSGPKGVNGIVGDDIVTGVLVIGGGVVIIAGLALGGLGEQVLAFLRPVRLAAAWAWVLSFAIVVVTGYAIEMHEAYFGAGDPKAPGAGGDAVYSWYHQDIAFFLLPTIVGVMLAIERLGLVNRASSRWIGGGTLVGTTVVFLGGLIWVFADSSLFGPGYIVATLGLAVLGVAVASAFWSGVRPRNESG